MGSYSRTYILFLSFSVLIRIPQKDIHFVYVILSFDTVPTLGHAFVHVILSFDTEQNVCLTVGSVLKLRIT
jgi:hypothetical protein